MASKCFCDACGAEMSATGSRSIKVDVGTPSESGVAGDVRRRLILLSFAVH